MYVSEQSMTPRVYPPSTFVPMPPEKKAAMRAYANGIVAERLATGLYPDGRLCDPTLHAEHLRNEMQQAERTTPTGVPFIDCNTCGKNHPATRRHCKSCGIPSVFINPLLLCLDCNAARPIIIAEDKA
ncbi:hypothetical protein [Arthrobacter sp. ISL-95]|uniref:hypothetical protein n=1 Tax=Arthrobacter sp. ISL-95 TaxID=2819116 RepID=UPI001BE94E4C|nr:hypothetical protein [Arthrobacter sp. ISL-95]MBT2587924.1 hypothetical protein [Arthrobacter sp. ISL-95]